MLPQSSPPHCAGTGKVRKVQRWLKHSKNERSALEEQHLLLTVTARALELNKGDWELAQTHVLVCTCVLSPAWFASLPGNCRSHGRSHGSGAIIQCHPCVPPRG